VVVLRGTVGAIWFRVRLGLPVRARKYHRDRSDDAVVMRCLCSDCLWGVTGSRAVTVVTITGSCRGM
jgi:hypothetical protein